MFKFFKKIIRKIKRFFSQKKKTINRRKRPIIKENNSIQEKYRIMYNDFEPNEKIKHNVKKYIDKIKSNFQKYAAVEARTGCPKEIIACIHLLEGSLRFDTVLHNGEKLKDVNRRGTRLVPKKRGKGKNWTWEDAAIDALLMEKRKFPLIWSTGSSLEFLERFNGTGYRRRGIETPYLWSYTNYYTKGKYVSDGKFSSSAVSKQIGAAIILRELNYLTIRI